ncbi:hypothetical protein LCGC14_1740670, partial [marine sediment metagenome]
AAAIAGSYLDIGFDESFKLLPALLATEIKEHEFTHTGCAHLRRCPV